MIQSKLILERYKIPTYLFIYLFLQEDIKLLKHLFFFNLKVIYHPKVGIREKNTHTHTHTKREREKERERIFSPFHPLVHSTDRHNNQCCEPGRSQEPGASSRCSVWVQGFKHLGLFCCFPRPLLKNWVEGGAPGRQAATHLGCWHFMWQHYLLCNNASPGDSLNNLL